ncbi:MAG: tetratricopeptide repeat protein [Candidatus Heimdallarchaeota archaeon]|nr:MAG: tetratricopeptide repeat protein [Candidatus Heimdallarchaeota archaeon]
MNKMTRVDERIIEFSRQGKFHEIVKMLNEEIPKVDSQKEKLRLEYQLAEAYYSIRKFEKGKKIVERILPVFQEHSNHSMVGNSENLLGKIYRIHQRYQEAIAHYKNAEEAFKLAENNEGLSKIYHNIGNVYIFLERFKEAKKYHLKALQFAEQEKRPDAIASSHLNIGSMFYQNGEVDQALFHFEKARELFEEIQDIPSLAATYHNLGEIYLLRQDFNAAIENSSKAESFYDKQRNIIGQTLALTTLARSFKASGSLDKAIKIYNQVIDLKPTEDIFLELGECYLSQNQLKKAKTIFEKISESPTSSLHGLGYSFDYLARIAIDQGEFETAQDRYIKLLEVLDKLTPKDPESIASTQGNLGYIFLKTQNFEHAQEYFQQASNYFKKKRNWEELITLGSNFRMEFVIIQDYEKAIAVLSDHVLPAIKKSKDKMIENQYHYEIALLYHLNGATDEGLAYWQRNHQKKVPFQKYSVPLLSVIKEENTKKELEKQHLKFLKRVIELKRSK